MEESKANCDAGNDSSYDASSMCASSQLRKFIAFIWA